MIFPKKVLAVALILIIVGAALYFVFFKNKRGTESEESAGQTSQEAAKTEEPALPVVEELPLVRDEPRDEAALHPGGDIRREPDASDPLVGVYQHDDIILGR